MKPASSVESEEGDRPRIAAVRLRKRDRELLRRGFSNEVLWPLCHGFQMRCRFERTYWEGYRDTNVRYAKTVQRVASPSQIIWVPDYHLMSVASVLRARGFANRVGYYHCIPFPPPESFERLPWAREILTSLLDYDLIGFQTPRDRRNFTTCVDLLGPESTISPAAVRRSGGRTTRLGVFAMSVDWKGIREGAATAEIAYLAKAARAEIGVERIVLGVDRLDYTKGITEKLRGFERLLDKHPDLRGRVTLVQLVIPTEEELPDLDRLRVEIDRTVGRINGRFTRRGWVPIQYRFQRWGKDELLALYRAADVMLITSLRDGMNLVAKEFVAANVDRRGVLVLSPFSGAAHELAGGALVVNPYDSERLAETIRMACTMPAADRAERLGHMEERVRLHDCRRWVDAYLSAAAPGILGPPRRPIQKVRRGANLA